MSEFSTQGYLDMELLRFTTAGSVDDGKSTLIGRLLYDSKSIFEDQMEQIVATSERRGEEGVNLALLTDGLRAEREQGITIDVAYRYFATPRRKFIIADTPGHIQYTRNMVTGASTANAAIILIDARNGVVEQTRRHAFIASLLGIPHLLVCINKMDLVDWDRERFEQIQIDFREALEKIGDNADVHFLPISALKGDNVVERSQNMKWYGGATLLGLLENLPIADDFNRSQPRLPVQYVIRPMTDEFHDYRGYAGRVAGGVFHVGDGVKVLPGGQTSTIASIESAEGQLQSAFAPLSTTLRLSDDIDISRGDMIVSGDCAPKVTREIEIMVCWLDEVPLQLNGKYALKHTTRDARCVVQSVDYKIDMETLQRVDNPDEVRLNDIARVKLKTTAPLCVDPYRRNRETGSLILIDEATNVTVGAGMIQ